MILELFHNVTLLVTLSVALQLLAQRIRRPGLLFPVTAGLLFGFVGIVAMVTPLHFAPGIIFDGRSIIISLAGFYGGPITALMAALMTSAYRLYLGGGGAIVGVLVIAESALLGVLYYYLRRRNRRWEHPLLLWLFGVIVQAAMLMLQLFLPNGVGWMVVVRIAPSVLLLYPLAFLVVALVFLENERRQGLEAVLTAQNRLLEMIAGGAPLERTLTSLVHEIERQAPGMMASVLLLDDSGKHLHHVAAPSLPDTYIAAIDGSAIGEAVGSCGTAAWRGEQVIVNDIATDPLWTDFRELALRHKLRACWSTPITDNQGRVLGTFALYYHAVALPTTAQLQLIDLFTHTASIAITRQRQEDVLRAERDFARQVMDAMGEGLSVTDAESRFTYVNPAFAAMVGRRPEEMIGRDPVDYVVEGDRAMVRQLPVQRRQGERSTFEVRLLHRDGSMVQALVSGVPRHLKGQYVGSIAVITDQTDRQRADLALRESEARYRLLVDSSPYAIGIHQDGVLVFANRAAAELLGAGDPSELLGRPIASIIAPAGLAETNARIGRVLAGETGLYPAVDTYVRLDGREVPVEVIAAPFFFGGKPAVQVIARDITERKRRRRELEAQARLAQVLGETADLQLILERILEAGIYAVEAAQKGSILLVDEGGQLRIRAASGYNDPRVRNAHFSMASGYGARSFRQKAPLLVSDVAGDPELAYTGDIEEIASVKSAIVAPLLLQGKALGVIGLDNTVQCGAFSEHDLRVLSNFAATATLVLERARLFDEVNQNVRQMEKIMQSAPQGLVLMDAAGKVLMANPIGVRDLETLAGARVGDTISALGDRMLGELLPTPAVGPWNEVRAADRIFEIIARPITDESGGGQWVVLIDDVTRSRQVAQQVQQQERLAAVGQLAAGIAHDFNNILTVILLQAQLAEMSPQLTDVDRRRINVVEEQAHHATELVRQILDFGRQAVLQRQPVDMHLLVNEQIVLLERTFPETIRVTFDPCGDPCIVTADPTRLRQVVINLAINARDAMREGGALSIGLSGVHIESDRHAPVAGMSAGRWVRLTVSDTGGGIAQDVLPYVFDPFYTTKEPGKGTGLGLAQVHGIVAQHDGHLTVATEVGKGTTFAVYLPAAIQAEADAPASPPARTYPKGHGERLLLVEDNPTLRLAMIDMLESLNYSVVDASNGKEALDQLARMDGEVALVLSDVVMPDMGGVAMVHALRSQGSDLPVVLMSGHPLDEEHETLSAAGVTAWLTKPCSLTELAHTLSKALPARST